MKLTLSYPLNLPFKVTQNFGENAVSFYKDMGLLGHNGIDYAVPTGTPIYASHDGVVVFAGHDNSAGLGIVIRTNEPFEYNGKETYFKTIYWHLKEGSIIVNIDQKVTRGQKIAEANNTGMSTGSHLHFGLKPVYPGEDGYTWFNLDQNNGYLGAIDPFPYLNGESPSQISKRAEAFNKMMLAVRDYQLECGFMDFKDETNPKKINIGPKTLWAIRQDKRL